MNVISQLFNDFLSGCRIANDFNLLSIQVVDSVLDALDLLDIPSFFVSGMEPNQSFQNFVSNQMSIFLLDLFLQLFDMMIDLRIVISDGLVEAND